MVVGSKVTTTSTFFSQFYSSQNRQLTLSYSLRNDQSYLMKAYVLFPAEYVTKKAVLKVSIDG